MVHAIKLGWKIGCGKLSDSTAAKVHALIELGYLCGSITFAIGTVFFFPVEGLEDFVLGCRFYEVGSLIFVLLTGYSEIDRWYAWRLAQKEGKPLHRATKRAILEQFLYCLGSFVFLIGTFLFDPEWVAPLSIAWNTSKATLENTAAFLFMFGSFLFSLGAYTNALSIFEAPRMFRKTLVVVTSSYMFGGLMFIAGTMGYVEAFEPNLPLKWCATWFYLIGCLFYCTGGFLALVSVVARHQKKFENAQAKENQKKKRLVRLLSRAKKVLPRALKGRKSKSKGNDADSNMSKSFDDEDNRSVGSDDLADLEAAANEVFGDNIDEVEKKITEELASVLGPEVGREIVDAIGEREEEDDDVFGAFWRAATGATSGSSAFSAGEVQSPSRSNKNGGSASGPGGRPIGSSHNDRTGFLDANAKDMA